MLSCAVAIATAAQVGFVSSPSKDSIPFKYGTRMLFEVRRHCWQGDDVNRFVSGKAGWIEEYGFSEGDCK